MNPENSVSTEARLTIGLVAAVIAAMAIGSCVEMIGESLAILSGVLAAIVGLVSTVVLKNASPRREQPSTLGAVAIMLLLACYIVIGIRIIDSQSVLAILGYLLSGAALTWLLFTSTAETPLLSAFGIGGFFCGFLGIIVTAIYSDPFNPLLGQVADSAQGEITWIYAAIALTCAIPGAFGAIAGRLSGWGLAEHQTEEIWAFTADGRLYTRKDTH